MTSSPDTPDSSSTRLLREEMEAEEMLFDSFSSSSAHSNPNKSPPAASVSALTAEASDLNDPGDVDTGSSDGFLLVSSRKHRHDHPNALFNNTLPPLSTDHSSEDPRAHNSTSSEDEAITRTVLRRKQQQRLQRNSSSESNGSARKGKPSGAAPKSNSVFAVLALEDEDEKDRDSSGPSSRQPSQSELSNPAPTLGASANHQLDGSTSFKRRRKHKQKQSKHSSFAFNPSQPAAAPNSTQIFFNIEPANIAEALLLITPFLYALRIHFRGAQFYAARDDFNQKYSLLSLADSDHTLSQLFHLRAFPQYNSSFFVWLALLVAVLLIGTHREAAVLRKSPRALVAVFNSFFPHILYAAILPPLLSLATNPQHLAFFHTNLLSILAYIPFSAPELHLLTQLPLPITHVVSLRRILCALVEPTLPGVMDHVLAIQDALALIAQNSLSQVEAFLLATLLVNLFYFASFNTLKSPWHDPAAASASFPNIPLNVKSQIYIASVPVVVLKALIFGACLIAVYPTLPLVFKIMKTQKLNATRPLSQEDKARVTRSQIKDANKALAIYLVAALGSVLLLFLYIDLPNLSSQPPSTFSALFYPISFIFNNVLFPSQATTKAHLAITAYWLAIIAVTIPTVQARSGSWTHLDLRRKVWHLTVVALFLPVGLPTHPTFTKLAMAGATFLFLAIEFLRVTTIPPLGPQIHRALLRYLDPRDICGPIIVSHIYLLIGISIPMYLCNSPAGIICLGLGDAAASVFGRMYGKHKWSLPRGNKKSVEGTLCFVAAAVAGLCLYKYAVLKTLYPDIYYGPAYMLDSYNPFVKAGGLTFFKMIVVATLTALLEAFSSLNDNVIVPLYMTALVQLC